VQAFRNMISRIPPGVALTVLAVLGLVCIRERRIIGETMAVIAAVTAVAVAAIVAAAGALVALRWRRYLRDRRNPAPEGGEDLPVASDDIDFEPSVDWEAAFARLDPENRR
jgi:hypothetical protein